MKIDKIDHIHIYVKDLEKAREVFEKVLGTKFSETIMAENYQVKSRIDPLGLEILQATSPESPIARHIEKRGEGLTAIAVKVPNIEEATKELQSKGLTLVGKINLGGIQEAQFHPKDTFGVMIELAQYDEVHGAALACLQKPQRASRRKKT